MSILHMMISNYNVNITHVPEMNMNKLKTNINWLHNINLRHLRKMEEKQHAT